MAVAAVVESHLIQLRERLNALEALAAIDQLILTGAEIDPVIDALLEHMATVTRCDAACIALPRRDVAAEGWQVYLRTMDGKIERLAMQLDAANPVLAALQNAAAKVVRVWPAGGDRRLSALLGVGFNTAQESDQHLEDQLEGFAQRLSLALIKSEREERLYRQAHYDALTGLPNRLLFKEQLAEELQRSQSVAQGGVLLYIDLDFFKRINDTLGHLAGDQMLCIVAQRLRGCLKETDTVARLSGDEFTVILRDIADQAAVESVVQRVLGTLSAPLQIGGAEQRIGASIGVAYFPVDGASGSEAGGEQMIHRADAAMYLAKQSGRGRMAWFKPA